VFNDIGPGKGRNTRKMTVALEIIATSPTGSVSAPITPIYAKITADLQEPARLHCKIENRFDDYLPENDPANNVQANSLIEFTRNGDVIFYGYIPNKKSIRMSEQFIEFVALDMIGKLRQCLASIDGDPLFTRTTPAVTMTEYALRQATAIGDTLYPFYPEPGDADPWIPSANLNQTTLYVDGVGGAIGPAVTTIVATAQNRGFPPLGLIRIGTEWIQYDGYDYSSGSDRYRFKNCTRGALGTTAATHTEGATIYLRKCQGIHPTVPVFVEGYNTVESAWEPIADDMYVLAVDECRFDFQTDILNWTTSEVNYNALRATFAVFDEDHVDAVNLGSIATDVLTESRENGGPGFTDGVDLEVDSALDAIHVARVRVGKSENCLAFLENLIDEMGLKKADDEDLIGIYYDQGAKKVTVAPVAQKSFLIIAVNTGTRQFTVAQDITGKINVGDVVVVAESTGNDRHYTVGSLAATPSSSTITVEGEIPNATADGYLHNADARFAIGQYVNEDIDLNEVKSAVLMVFHSGQNTNLASPDKMWHPAHGENVGDNSVPVQSVVYQDEEEKRLDGWDMTNDVFGNNHFTERLVDGVSTSGWGLRFAAEPGANADVLYGWFTDGLDTRKVDTVEVILDCRRRSVAPDTYHFEFLGVDANFDKNDPTNIPEANKINLSGALDFRLPHGGTDAFNQVEIGSDEIAQDLQGFVCRFNGMSHRVNINQSLALIKEIKITGRQERSVLVQLTRDDTQGAEYLYAPNTYARLLNWDGAQTNVPPQVDRIEIGQATYNSAVSLGRLVLLQRLAYHKTRFYVFESHLANKAIPEVGGTITVVQDDFTGVVLHKEYTARNGRENLRTRLMDFRSVII
jgi:hypothetical protein